MYAAALLLAAAVSDADPAAAQALPPTRSEASRNEEGGPPIVLQALYTAEVDSDAAGGLRRGTRYLDNLDLILDADLGATIGWRGAKAHAYVLYNNGHSISELAGDAQALSNIETGVRALRLYEAWIEQQIVPAVSVRAGLYDLNSEFDALETSGLFIGSPHGIGTEIGQTGLNGPSIFPVTSLAARIEAEPDKGWKLRAAVLDGVPGDPDHPARTAIKLGGGDGALLIAEGEVPLAGGRLIAGHWQYTAKFEAHDGGRGRGNAGSYVRGEAPLLERGDRKIDSFFRLGTANGRFNMFDGFASGGIQLTGWIAGRKDDQLGLAVASAFTSSDYRARTAATRSELSVEATYRAPINRWLTVQPSAHYIRSPSADPAIADALVLSLRVEVGFRLPN